MTQSAEVIAAMRERKRAYQTKFGRPDGQPDDAVVADLKRFCRANESCGVAMRGQPVDINRTMIAIGRNEVWLRIWQHLNLTPEELAQLYGAVAPNQDTDQ